MSHVKVFISEQIATVTLARGKVNALNEAMIEEMRARFEELEQNEKIKVVILTGQGKFFSFGFDVPDLMGYAKDAFISYLTKFTDFYAYLFMFPKPVVGALNGHTIAGGCMIATACDCRIMVAENAKIALNEITFGASLIAGSVEMLKYCTGSRNAETILYSGAFYSPREALGLGLVDRIESPETLMQGAEEIALEMAQKNPAAFKGIKGLLRRPVAEAMVRREPDSIREFADIWYSKETWADLQNIIIHS